jgi:hypothetical protein
MNAEYPLSSLKYFLKIYWIYEYSCFCTNPTVGHPYKSQGQIQLLRVSLRRNKGIVSPE